MEAYYYVADRSNKVMRNDTDYIPYLPIFFGFLNHYIISAHPLNTLWLCCSS